MPKAPRTWRRVSGRDQHPVDGCRSLEPAGPVDGRADRDEPVARAFAEGADHHLAGVDADPHVQRDAVPAYEIGVEVVEVREHRQGRPDRAVGVVLVGAAEAEDRHHRVADELLDHAAVLLDRPLPAGEVGVDDLAGVLGVELAGEHGEVDEVGEHDGDEPALLGAGPSRAPRAGPAADPARCRPRRHRGPRAAPRGRRSPGRPRRSRRGAAVGCGGSARRTSSPHVVRTPLASGHMGHASRWPAEGASCCPFCTLWLRTAADKFEHRHCASPEVSNMRVEATVMSMSWIPSDSLKGALKAGMDLRLSHWDAAAARPGQGRRGGARAVPARQVPVRQRALGLGRGRGRPDRRRGPPRHQRSGDGRDHGPGRPDRGHLPGGLAAGAAARARARRRVRCASCRRSAGARRAVAAAGAAPAVRPLAGAARLDHPRA